MPIRSYEEGFEKRMSNPEYRKEYEELVVGETPGEFEDEFSVGGKVRFLGDVTDSQIKWGNHTDPRGVLEKGQEYTLTCVEVCSWHTKLFLANQHGSFNSVWFERVAK